MLIEIYPEQNQKKYFNIIKKTIDHFFLNKKINPQAVVAFNFVPIFKIKALNQKYRNLNKPTDVLSFPIWQSLKEIPKKGIINLGDIFICFNILRSNAQKEGKDEAKELQEVIIHSLNHLIGKHH